ncbi:hypothetical protein ACRAVF_22610 [Bradyrhizobium oligotrophicum S58]
MLIKFWQIKGGLTMNVCFAGKEGKNRAKFQPKAILPPQASPEEQHSTVAGIRKTSQATLTIELRQRVVIDDLTFGRSTRERASISLVQGPCSDTVVPIFSTRLKASVTYNRMSPGLRGSRTRTVVVQDAMATAAAGGRHP